MTDSTSIENNAFTFSFPPPPSARYIDTISRIMLSFAILCFIGASVYAWTAHTFSLLNIIAIAIILFLAFILWKSYPKNEPNSYFSLRNGLLLAAIGFLFSGYIIWISIPFLMAFFLEKQTKQIPYVLIDANGAAFNGLIPKNIPWESISNLVLKEGLLTIDLKNNTLIQKEVTNSDSTLIESSFNKFCLESIAKNK